LAANLNEMKTRIRWNQQRYGG